MIPAGVQIFVALETVDLRYGFAKLSGLVREQIGYDATSGALFVFYGRRRDALKILFADGTGTCLFYKRLMRGTFRLPERTTPDARHVEVDDAALDALLDGIDVEAAVTKKPRRRRVH